MSFTPGIQSRWRRWLGGLLFWLLALPNAGPGGAAELPDAPYTNADWPCWRGPGGSGARTEPLPVLHWSETNGVLWKVAVPGEGHASPIVVGDRVIVSTADEQTQGRTVFCYHRNTGALLWSTLIHGGGFPTKHDKNSHATPTPACDGRRVYVPYLAGDALWLSALDLRDGQIVWQPRIGPFVSEWGYASSPVLSKDLVIVVGDNKGSPDGPMSAATSYLTAVHRETGNIVWSVNRPLAPSYGTPGLARLAGRDQLVLGGASQINAYDPATGKELWSCRWSAQRVANAVVCGPDCVYASATWPRPEVVCVRADGNGDVTDSHVLWRQTQGATDVPSPLYHEGRLYLANDKGMATCLDGATGQVVWQQRLGGSCSASPVLAGDHLFATNERGITSVLKVGPRFEVVARNALNDAVLASPAISGDRLFLRGRKFLWCLDGKAVAAQPPPALPPGTKVAVGGLVPPLAPDNIPVSRGKPIAGANHWLWATELIGLAITLLFLGVIGWLSGRRSQPRADGSAVASPDRSASGGTGPLALRAGGTGRTHASVSTKGRPDQPVAIVRFVSFPCPGCGRNFKVRAELAGNKGRCPECRKILVVPASAVRP